MKQKLPYRITAITMAFLMLFTSVGFSVDTHFCKGEFKSLSFLGEAQSCHSSKKSCPNHPTPKVEDSGDKKCCTNSKFQVDDIDVDFVLSGDIEFTDLQLKFITAFVSSYYSFDKLTVEYKSYVDLSDPLPPLDIYVLLERFLI